MRRPRSNISWPLNTTPITQQQRLATKPSATILLRFVRIWYPVLEVNCQQRSVSPTLLLQCYETMQTRTSRVAWLFTHLLGELLPGFGIAIWSHPHVVSYTMQDTKASLFSLLFTLALGLWRTILLLAQDQRVTRPKRPKIYSKTDVFASFANFGLCGLLPHPIGCKYSPKLPIRALSKLLSVEILTLSRSPATCVEVSNWPNVSQSQGCRIDRNSIVVPICLM